MQSPKKVLFITTSLGTGGAEAVLYHVASSIKDYKIEVVSLTLHGKWGDKLKDSGIPIYFGFLSLIKRLFVFNPDLVQGWMYHGNLIACLGWIIRAKVIWSIHQGVNPFDKRLTRFIVVLLKSLSFFVTKISYVSNQGRSSHESIGFDTRKGIVIHNGFVIQNERMIESTPNIKIIGCIGRSHPVKRHQSLLKSFWYVLKKRTDVKLVVIGRGVSKLVVDPFLKPYVSIIEETNDIESYIKDFYVCVLPSQKEGFPLVIGEAMSFGIPCISTHVGDCKEIIGPSGTIVDTFDEGDFANAILDFLNLSLEEYQMKSKEAQNRITSFYSVEKMIKEYHELYQSNLDL